MMSAKFVNIGYVGKVKEVGTETWKISPKMLKLCHFGNKRSIFFLRRVLITIIKIYYPWDILENN